MIPFEVRPASGLGHENGDVMKVEIVPCEQGSTRDSSQVETSREGVRAPSYLIALHINNSFTTRMVLHKLRRGSVIDCVFRFLGGDGRLQIRLGSTS